MGLQEYNRKRDFKLTPEPKGQAARRTSGPLSWGGGGGAPPARGGTGRPRGPPGPGGGGGPPPPG